MLTPTPVSPHEIADVLPGLFYDEGLCLIGTLMKACWRIFCRAAGAEFAMRDGRRLDYRHGAMPLDATRRDGR